ncbi:MAG: phosphopantetheine-binding protein [Rhodovibrionaceae bacterium]
MTEMKQDQQEIYEKVCSLLEPFNNKELTLNRETDISSDLEIDSVAVLDFIMEVEDEYDISFPMNRISEIRTIGELVEAISELGGKH